MADAEKEPSGDQDKSAPSAATSRSGADEDGGPLELGLAGGILAVILGAVIGLAVRFRSRRSAT